MYAVITPLIRLPRGRDWFDYGVPDEMREVIRPGQIVDIPFRKRTVKGVVIDTHDKKPSFAVRPVKKILTLVPFLTPANLALAQSIAIETATPLSIVLKSFLPVIKVRELVELKYLELPQLPVTSSKSPLLLHWHTESARNTFYQEKVTAALAQGTSALIITAREPDIATLTQLFSNTPVVSLPPQERIERIWDAWKEVRAGKPTVLIGTRSAVFAPFAHLGLIIVDQEHDENLKQEEPAPRYHARRAALALANYSGAEIIMSSPVPSLESFHAVQTGVMEYQEIGDVVIPEITLVNLDDEHKKDLFSFIAPDTITAIDKTLAQEKSVFILVDRLGAATVLKCLDCNHEWKCIDCGAYLAEHGLEKILRCQRCGATSSPPTTCPQCHGFNIKHAGAGTERIASLAATLKPDWSIIRLDSLTATKTPPKTLALTKPSVIIGTRFALAHLGASRLGLAISLTTDQMLSRAEFRTHEDTFRILFELARTAGHLIAYTRDPNHWVLGALTKPYAAFYNEEARIRKRWHYPPFTPLTRLIVQDVSKTALIKKVAALARKIKIDVPTCTVSGPYDLQPARIRNRWRMGILLKGNDPDAMKSVPWNKLIDADVILDVQPNSIT